EEERYRINVFDWNAEFTEIMKSGGFDAVIGNPPYVRQEGLGEAKEYYLMRYKSFRSTADLYVNFIEKGIRLLNKAGLFSMIVSNKWLRAAYGQPLREFLTNNGSVLEIVDLAGLPVFAKATVRTIILICHPTPKQTKAIRYLAPLPLEDFYTINSGERLREFVDQRAVELPFSGLSAAGWSFSKPGSHQVLQRIKQNGASLEEYVGGRMFRGVVTGMNKAFIIDRLIRKRLIAKDQRSAEIIKPVLVGKDIRRYSIAFQERYLIFARRGININRYPAVLKYLTQFKKELTPKRTGKEQHGRKPGNYEWYEIQDTIDYYAEFEKPKIIYPDIATTCRFALDKEGYFGSNTTYFIPSNDLYLLGILNSKLALFYFSEVCAGLEGGATTYLRFFGQYLENFPVRPINLSDPADKARHDRIVSMVKRMLDLYKQLASAKNPNDKTRLQREIEATDRQIDQLVYELYGLTEEEIKIVEEGS
ncbi:MAG: Eco57I restriction-modification methylase domain-containing protein, partial [Candidatus Binatia bacterium]